MKLERIGAGDGVHFKVKDAALSALPTLLSKKGVTCGQVPDSERLTYRYRLGGKGVTLIVTPWREGTHNIEVIPDLNLFHCSGNRLLMLKVVSALRHWYVPWTE